MTDEQFCKIESALTGEPMDKVEQLVSKTFTGRELKEYLEGAFALYNVSNRISEEEIKRYRKEGRLSGAIKREPFYKLIAQKFDENYNDTDFDILYDC